MLYRLRTRLSNAREWFWVAVTTWTGPRRLARQLGAVLSWFWINLVTLNGPRRVLRQFGAVLVGLVYALRPFAAARFLGRAMAGTAVGAWTFLITRPKWQLAAGTLTAAALGVSAVYVVVQHRRMDRTEPIRAYLRQADKLLLVEEIDLARRTLEDAALLAPDEPQVRARLAALKTGEAEADDPAMLRMLMRRHARAGRSAEAAREAGKLLQTLPTDWDALCILASDALQRGDRAAAAGHLAALPSADQAGAYGLLGPGSALFAMRLHGALGNADAVGKINEFVVDRLFAPLQKGAFRRVPASDRLDMLECYVNAVRMGKYRAVVVEHWTPMRAVAVSAPAAQGMNAGQWSRLAGLLEACVSAWADQARQDPLHPLYPQLAAQADEDLRQILDQWPADDEAGPAAHLARLRQLVRRGDMAGARAALRRGQAACPGNADLAAARIWLISRDDPAAALAAAEEMLEREPASLERLRLAAEAARTAARPDKAADFCRRAGKVDPKSEWARRMEAEILLDRGSFTQAAALLEPVRAALSRDPLGTALYVRALCRCSAVPLAEEFLEQLADAGAAPAVLAGGVAALVSDGPPEAGHRWARRLASLHPEEVQVRRVLADCLWRVADRGAAGWDSTLVRQSLAEYRWVRAKFPDDLTVLWQIVRLELHGLDAPDTAYRSAEPLLKFQDAPELRPDLAELLGEVLVGARKFEEAKPLLERAALARPTIRTYCGLARALWGMQRRAEAEHYLARASGMPKTERESAEVVKLAAELAKR